MMEKGQEGRPRLVRRVCLAAALLLALSVAAGVAWALLWAVYPEEAVSLTEALGKAVSSAREEALSASEALVLGRPLEEAASMAEVISKSISKVVAESTSVVEQAVKSASKSVSEAASVSESLAFARPVFEQVGVVEEAVKGAAKALMESAALLEQTAYSYAKPPEAVSLAELIAKSASKLVGESAGVVELAARQVVKAPVEAVAAAERVVYSFTLSEASLMQEAVGKAVSKAALESTALGELVAKLAVKAPAEAASFSELIGYGYAFPPESVGISELSVRSASKVPAEGLAAGEALVKSGSKALAEPASIGEVEFVGVGKPTLDSLGVSESYFILGPAYALNVVSVSPAEIVADGATTSVVTFQLLDELRHPLPSRAVAFSSDYGTVYPTEAYTDASGYVSTTLKSEPGRLVAATVTARTVMGRLVQNTTTVNFIPDSYGVSLGDGWNLISLPLIPTDASIEAVLHDIIDEVEVVWFYNASERKWYVYTPGPAPDTLTEMRDGWGYFVKMKAPATLTVRGFVTPAFPAAPPTYRVVPGWNLMGFKSKQPLPVQEYLRALGSKWASIWRYGPPWLKVLSTDSLAPGQGYWLYALEEGVIVP